MKEKMNQRLFLAGCLGLAMCVQAVELDTVDPWRIKEGADAIAVPAVDLVTGVGEQPYRDEDPTRRAFTPIRLKAGANRVKLVMPRTSGAFWGATFSPALGTSVHPRDSRWGTDMVFTATPRECCGKGGISLRANPVRVLVI